MIGYAQRELPLPIPELDVTIVSTQTPLQHRAAWNDVRVRSAYPALQGLVRIPAHDGDERGSVLEKEPRCAETLGRLSIPEEAALRGYRLIQFWVFQLGVAHESDIMKRFRE